MSMECLLWVFQRKSTKLLLDCTVLTFAYGFFLFVVSDDEGEAAASQRHRPAGTQPHPAAGSHHTSHAYSQPT